MFSSLGLRPARRRAKIKPHCSKTRLDVERLEERQVLSAATLWDIGSGVYDLSQTLLLHSNPTAKHTIYLDFDGYTTGNVTGTSWDNLTSPAWDPSGNGAAFTTAEMQTIQRVWARVAEDFAPFNVNVTTQDPGDEALRKSGTTDDRWGIRVVITPNDAPAPGSGGVAYIGSFNFNNLTPVYVFNSSEKAIAEAATHEVGHSLSLGHDGTATLGYYGGHGTGTTAWGPIMGAAYSPNVTQWSKGEYSGANNTQDDLAIITANNGFTYRSDDYGSTQSTAFTLLPQGASTVSTTYGIIERNTDSDWFSFYSNAGAINLNVNPLNIGPNLAIQAELYSASGTLLTTVNPAGALNAVVSFTIPTAGQYFLKVVGTGKGNPLNSGFSNYASLGNYRITGTVQAYTGTGPVNSPPIANPDTATTVTGVPVTIDVLANDSDPNGDPLTLTGIGNVTNGTAVISGNSVIFTPNAGFVGTGSFTYTISDGRGGVTQGSASVIVNQPTSNTLSFTNDTNVTISSTRTSIVTSTINLSGLTGTVQDVDIKINLRHTWISDLRITLIAPDGTRIILFNRHGGSGDNLTNTIFNDAATVGIANGSAPFNGSFKPTQLLSALNGKNPNGAWRLEVQDYYRQDGGYLDNWTLTITTAASAAASNAGSYAFGNVGASALNQYIASFLNAPQFNSDNALPARVYEALAKRFPAIADWIANHAGHGHDVFELDFDFPVSS